jgi:cytoskeletal protein RodZ
MQEKISSGVLKWDKLKAAMEWEERKLSPTSSQQATKQRVDSNKKTKKERDNTIDKSSH